MALIPRQFFDAVVAIGFADTSGATNYAATGFLYGQPVGGEANQEKVYRVFLITNRHVFEQQEKATLRFNMLADEPAKEYTLSLRGPFGRPAWFAHPDPKIDIAVACPLITKFKAEGIRFSYFREDSDASGVDACRAGGVSEGDGVFVLGFPMGDVGVVKSYTPYKDVAVSLQTRQPWVVFEENSGLSQAYPVDFIKDKIALATPRSVARIPEAPLFCLDVLGGRDYPPGGGIRSVDSAQCVGDLGSRRR